MRKNFQYFFSEKIRIYETWLIAICQNILQKPVFICVCCLKTDLIDYDIVVLDCSLGALVEVLCERVHHLVEELDDEERGHLLGHDSYQIQSVSVDGHQVVMRSRDHWLHVICTTSLMIHNTNKSKQA